MHFGDGAAQETVVYLRAGFLLFYTALLLTFARAECWDVVILVCLIFIDAAVCIEPNSGHTKNESLSLFNWQLICSFVFVFIFSI